MSVSKTDAFPLGYTPIGEIRRPTKGLLQCLSLELCFFLFFNYLLHHTNQKNKKFMARRLSILKQPIFSTFNNHLVDYPSPSNLSYWWGFGSLAGICLVIQIITGIFLAMHYTPHVDLAFYSVEHIMRDVQGGWLLRYMHANGASMWATVRLPEVKGLVPKGSKSLCNQFCTLDIRLTANS
jgi:hypothetical protein